MTNLMIDRCYLISWDAMEEFLMGEINAVEVEIWGSENCPVCEKVKAYYDTSGYTYYDIDELVSGERADVDAMVQLSFQDMRLPLIKVDGEWVDPSALGDRGVDVA